MRIAYVEDNLTNLALIERICQMNDDELVSYSDAEHALYEIAPDSTDLILMDLHLGNHSMNGLQLTRLLRQKGVAAPIIAITAYDTLGYPDEYREAGCNEYVRKPVEVNSMLALIERYR
ncbi:MAG: response regulator [Candidatus Flexifilum sp.]|jgi:CheY-like chemotaxis protein